MSCRKWLRSVLIGGCLVAGVVVSSVALAQQEAAAESATTHFAPGYQVDRETYRVICDSPKNKDHADLCQQWRVAEAAESQLTINIIGAGLVAFSLLFTGWAAFAASSAAKAANKAVETAQQTANLELRPYLTSNGFKFEWLHSLDDINKIVSWRLIVIWKNSGQTPAKNVHTWLNAQAFPLGETPAVIDFADTSTFESRGNPIGPGQIVPSRLEVPIEHFMAAYKKQKRFYYWAWIEYDGITPGARHRTEICVRLDVIGDPASKEMRLLDVVDTRFNAMDGECIHRPKTNGGT